MLYTTDAATARQMIPNIMLAFKCLMYILSGSDRDQSAKGQKGRDQGPQKRGYMGAK